MEIVRNIAIAVMIVALFTFLVLVTTTRHLGGKAASDRDKMKRTFIAVTGGLGVVAAIFVLVIGFQLE